ncbi:helix-turn-helix domain-containing protein [Propionivibrio limicola]|uniref:helix-turn-helix domain-containing protein n=1 Tax=Propionivibrio limicola TaxID=167645 RepID=UPI0012913D74|nr:helix-turn-helix domain-containing protein [Propionivibrio limicola]
MNGEVTPAQPISDIPGQGGDPSSSDAESAQAKGIVGPQLRMAREAAGWSVAEMSRMLKITPHQVEAIESENWADLPCETITRGFVRNYARQLGLDALPLMSALASASLPQNAALEIAAGTPVKLGLRARIERCDWIKVVLGLVVLALAIAAYIFVPADFFRTSFSFLPSAEPSSSQVEPEASDVGEAAGAAVSGQEVAPAESSTEPAIEAPAAPVQPPQADAPVPAAVAPAGPLEAAGRADGAVVGQLKFRFAQSSWVEIRNGKGEVIFSQLNAAGSQRVVEGQPPFALTIGNAGYVSLNYNGKDVDFSQRSKDNVARLTLE